MNSHHDNRMISSGTIRVREYDIPYEIVINHRRKHPYLSALPNGRCRMELPEPISEREIIRLLESEKEWIFREFYRKRPECPPETETKTICLHGIDVPYIIRRNIRVKKITLKIYGTETLEVSAPYNTGTAKIEDFVNSQSGWIAPRISLEKNGNQPLITPGDHKNCEFIPENDAKHIEYKGHIISYQIKRNRRAKRVTIKINHNKEVQVVSPLYIKTSEIRVFMQQKADWIYGHTIGSNRPNPPHRYYCDGEVWPFFGEQLTIRIKKGDRQSCIRSEKELLISIPVGLTNEFEKQVIKDVISSFFVYSLNLFCIPIFKVYAAKLGVAVPPLKFRDQKTKWGTCTSNSIVLNLRLCMAPPAIIEYVIAHELSHKVNPDHSESFWSTVEQIVPDYKERREYLKKNGFAWVL